jgi:hypothetical protein
MELGSVAADSMTPPPYMHASSILQAATLKPGVYKRELTLKHS